MNGLFISAINTNSGKTWLSSKLIDHLDLENLVSKNNQVYQSVIAIKPVQSGFKDKNDSNSDCSILKKASGDAFLIDDICMHSFNQAIAPNLAAQNNRVVYSINDLVRFCKKQLDQRFCLVEGAGGLFSPISHDGFNYDLAKMLNLPCLIVLSDELGCISSTIAHLIAARQKGIKVLAIVINRYEKSSLRQTKSELQKWLKKTGLNENILSISKDADEDEVQIFSQKIKELLIQNCF